jgi:hypothetical protein
MYVLLFFNFFFPPWLIAIIIGLIRHLVRLIATCMAYCHLSGLSLLVRLIATFSDDLSWTTDPLHSYAHAPSPRTRLMVNETLQLPSDEDKSDENVEEGGTLDQIRAAHSDSDGEGAEKAMVKTEVEEASPVKQLLKQRPSSKK